MVWERRGDEACLWSRRLIVQGQDRASSWAHTGKRKRIFGVYRRGDGETLSQRRRETFAIKLEKRRTATSSPIWHANNQIDVTVWFPATPSRQRAVERNLRYNFSDMRSITILWETLPVLSPAAGVSNIPKVSCFRESWFSFSCLFSQVITIWKQKITINDIPLK